MHCGKELAVNACMGAELRLLCVYRPKHGRNLVGDTGGRVPPLFQVGGDNMPCPPTFFSLGFVYGEVSKIKLMLVTFCVKSFLC